jgi:ribonuclease BN (tRNA processing enzyme)
VDDLVFIPMGTGSAFADDRLNSALLVCRTERGAVVDSLLIDIGETASIAFRLLDLARGTGRLFNPATNGLDAYDATLLPKGLPPRLRDVTTVVLTHTHADHVGGLANYLLCHRYLPGEHQSRGLPTVVSGPRVMECLWTSVLKGQVGTWREEPGPSLEVLARPVSIERGASGRWGPYELSLVSTDHVPAPEGETYPSYAVALGEPGGGRRLVWSGDTLYSKEQVLGSFGRFDVLFHDCQFAVDPTHAALDELLTLPAEIRGRTYLYHLPDDADRHEEAADRHFRGFLRWLHPYSWDELTAPRTVE